MWPIAILALIVVAIVVSIVIAPEDSRPRGTTTSADTPVSTGGVATHGKQLGIEIAFPQTFTGTQANTPTELTGGIAFSTAGAVASAPGELSGRFLAERAKQLGTEIGTTGTNGTAGADICEICWKYR
jgi:hypothetical protein